MGKKYIKQDIRALLQNGLLAKFGITSYGEVDRYNYATQLGTLEHIDYAIPLFGYANQIDKHASEIYSKLKEILTAKIPCKTEFVNGYANIMVDNEYLESTLKSHNELIAPETSEKIKAVLLLRSSSESEAVAATKLIDECLSYVGLDSVQIHPFPPEKTASGQYWIESDRTMRELLIKAPGVISEPDSKAVYLQQGDETHALCSVKGGWFALAFIIATIQEHSTNKNIFVIGSSEVNKLVRTIFGSIETLDTDTHAKSLAGATQRSVSALAKSSKKAFQAQDVNNMSTKQRRELLYILDFEYEIREAVRLGDLKRMIGEVTTLIEQHPLPDVARYK